MGLGFSVSGFQGLGFQGLGFRVKGLGKKLHYLIRTPSYGSYSIFLIMGNAGFIPSTPGTVMEGILSQVIDPYEGVPAKAS